MNNLGLNSTLTIKTFHFGFLPILSFLQSLGIASFLTVKHHTQNNDDISNSHSYGKADGLDHLVRRFPLILTGCASWLL